MSFHRVAYIAETYSLIMAICELDIEALCKKLSFLYHFLCLVCAWMC